MDNINLALMNSMIKKLNIDLTKTKELYYLVGCALSDATLSIRQRDKVNCGFYKYQFEIGVVDKEFAEKFGFCLNSVFNEDYKVFKILEKSYFKNKETGKKKYYEQYFYHTQTQKKDIVIFMKELINSLNVLEISDDLKLEIMRGMFDGEGCISQDKRRGDTRIIYGQKEPNFSIFCKLLSYFHIKYNLEKSERASGVKCLIINKEQSIKLYKLFGNSITIKRKDDRIKRWVKNGYITLEGKPTIKRGLNFTHGNKKNSIKN